MTTVRLVGGLAAFAAGMWLMIGMGATNTGGTLAIGWALAIVGICTAAPAALDAMGVE